jgi:hypothetical protein
VEHRWIDGRPGKAVITGRRRRGRGIVSAIAIGLLLQWAAGCGAVITPPPAVARPATIYITDYVRLSSLLLPIGDGRLEEFAFGDFQWFALNQNTWHDALRSLFCSAGSTLGRRELTDPNDPAKLVPATGADRVALLTVDAARAGRLRDELEFAYGQQSATEVFNPASGLYFVHAREPYSLFHNCNHVTARWLRELGCKVNGAAMTSKFALRPPSGVSR